MTDQRESFLDFDNAVISDAVWNAAVRGKVHAGPMIMELNHVHAVSRGLREIFKMARNNDIQKVGDGDGEAPLSSNTIDSLLAMGEAVAHKIVCDIEILARNAAEDLEASHA